LLTLGVPQREDVTVQIEDAEMADRRPPPVHDVHDRPESARLRRGDPTHGKSVA
jgi:hypothetical protein